MSVVRPELRLVRESLEAIVAPSIVSTVMFEALEEVGGDLPAGEAAVREFADGVLRRVLARKLGGDAHAICDELVTMLASIAPSASGEPRARRDPDVTREVRLDVFPVGVLVIAATSEFASRLSAALGPRVVSVAQTPTLDRLRDELDIATPQLVLIDAADFASIEPGRLAPVLDKLPATTVRAIWGADLPYGAALLRALVERSAPATPLDRREGIEPLLDLIRSRRSAG